MRPPHGYAAVLLCGLSLLTGPSATLAVADQAEGTLRFAGWRATAYGEEVAGFACWLAAADTALRIEILAAPDRPDADQPALTDHWRRALLERQGDGWTYAKAGQTQPGLLNRWGDEWRAVSPDLARLLRSVVARLATDPAALAAPAQLTAQDSSGPRRWRPLPRGRQPRQGSERLSGELWVTPPGDAGAAGPATESRATWRRELVTRGRGRGGLAEAFVLTWVAPEHGQAAPQLTLRSVRRPGVVRLWRLAAESVRYPIPEAFLPLWPLAQLLDR